MDYDLTRLGDSQFEHLVQALSIARFGARVRTFGVGPDGGREATCEGLIAWGGDQRWNGYTVIQAKYRSGQPRSDDAAWLRKEIRKELDVWANPASSRRTHGRLPDNLLIVTNVQLSAVAGRGGIDTVDAEMTQRCSALGILGCRVWHADDVRRLLDQHSQVRKTYAGFLVTGDVLQAVLDTFLPSHLDLRPVLLTYADKRLTAEAQVRLAQAGDPNNEKLALAAVGMDLPAYVPDLAGGHSPGTALGHIVDRIDRVARRSQREVSERPHVVLVGGPGQGKTTISQLLAQLYRVELLEDDPLLSVSGARLLHEMRRRQIAGTLPRALVRRWPVRLDLAEYASHLAPGSAGGYSVIQHVVSKVAEGQTELFASVRTWLATWPWLLILDGLDEAGAAEQRELVLDAIGELITVSDREDWDLSIVVTTRPQGFGHEDLDRQVFDHVVLAPLDESQSLAYAEQLSSARHSDDEQQRLEVQRKMVAAWREEHTRDLLTTPLQIAIVMLILERAGQLPHSRHELFNSYYETIYARERSKGPVARLLRDHEADVNAVHRAVALQALMLGESSSRPDVTVSTAELIRLVRQRLADEGYAGTQLGRLADEIVKAARNRLVLLVPQQADGVGFEVKSLAEYLAAWALVDASDDELLVRVELLGPAAYWRNVWLLLLGRIDTERAYLKQQLRDRIAAIDEGDIGMVAPVVPDLALDILVDNTFRAPGDILWLVELSLALVRRPTYLAESRAFRPPLALQGGGAPHEVVRTTLMDALGGPLAQQYAAARFAAWLLMAGVGPGATVARQVLDVIERRGELVPGGAVDDLALLGGIFGRHVQANDKRLARNVRAALMHQSLVDEDVSLDVAVRLLELDAVDDARAELAPRFRMLASAARQARPAVAALERALYG